MSIRRRIFLGIFLIVGCGLYFLLSWIIDDLTPQYRESTEEPLVDAARVLAAVAGATAEGTQVDVDLFRKIFDNALSQKFVANIYRYQKTDVDFRVYITDTAGKVLFDSDRGRDLGKDFSQWRDVRLTLAGEYGARTSRDIPGEPEASVMYVAAPIISGGQTIGVLSVGKPTRTANALVEAAQRKIVIGGVFTVICMLLTGLLVSAMLTRPIQRLTEYARDVRDGKRSALPKLAAAEIVELGEAFEEMRDSLEGKQYVERYVQTLTHEIKSPLAAIRGAVELLKENPPPDKQVQFLDNAAIETERIQQLVEKLLLLSNLEARKGQVETEALDLTKVIKECQADLHPLIEKKQLQVMGHTAADCGFRGDAFLIRHAVLNLLQNAVEFSPYGGKLTWHCEKQGSEVIFTVEDQGPGVPDYASARVFERFYSLKRPDTGKKSSGLGLSLVQEVAALHGGSASLTNLPSGGAKAVLSIPA